MKYTGSVAKEGLKDEGFLNFADSKKENGLIEFEVDADFASAIIEEMSQELRRGFFGIVKSEYETNVIFSEKIFTYSPQDSATKEKMIAYGTSLGIKKEELEKI